MNPFPRIHSLGTVNIIHHQEFFYQFHPFRTDFVGDSGVGKSIITDLLQLILIGSPEYSSSTQSKEERPFQTLALKTIDNTDFAYAYINVETAPNRYLVLGTYIARNQNQTQAFIIQQSLDFDSDNLIPLNEPISVDMFERDGKWLPIDELDRYFNEEKDLGFKKYRRFSEYHQILHANQLLPLDVTVEHALKDYAKILQTFARKNVNIKDGVDLQDFMFGKHWRTHFKKSFETVVSSMKDDIYTFRTNRDQLTKIERKQEVLKELYDLKSKLEISKIAWQQLNYQHLSQQKQLAEKSINTLLNKHFESRNILIVLKGMKAEKLEELSKEIPILKAQKETQLKEVDTLKRPFDNIDAIIKLMHEQKLTDVDAIREFYKEFNTNRKLYEVLQRGKKLLEQRELIVVFDALNHTQGLVHINQNLQSDLFKNQQELTIKNALLACNDIDDPHSLIYWALNNRPQLTPEHESMVLYFQNHSVKIEKPDKMETGDRYIPAPNVVIDAVTQKENTGFWADFGGVYSFFEYLKEGELLFNGNDEEAIKFKFRYNRNVLKQRINELKKVIDDGKNLQIFLSEVEEPQKLLEAWPKREHLNYQESDLHNEVLNLSEVQLNVILNDFASRDKISADYSEAVKKRDELIKQIGAKETLQTQLETFAVTQPGTVDDWMEELKLKCERVIKQEQDLNLNDNDYYADFKDVHNKAVAGLNVQLEVIQFQQILTDVDKQLAELELDTNLNFEKDIVGVFSTERLSIAKKEMDTCKANYTRAYGEAIANIVENDRSRLQQTEDFTVLVRHVLPAIFQKIDFKETEVWEKIKEYIDDILHRNAEINKNKLVKVHDLMRELHTEIGRQTNMVREVGNMLKRPEAEISGGLKASLKGDPNERIGINWITQFLDEMPTINEGLWSNSIEAYLSDREQGLQMSIDDLIIDEYKRYSDHPMPQITIEELLSPFAYYTLNYSIRTGSGINNSGSTGQTYTAMALLCIAKLSMMKKDQEYQSEGLRFMSIDEAAGIGSNLDMLELIAKKYGYQILSLSIPLHRIREGEQYIYRLYRASGEEFINKHPVAIFSNEI